MEFVKVIKDECGHGIYNCNDLRESEIEQILKDHPEYYIGYVLVTIE